MNYGNVKWYLMTENNFDNNAMFEFVKASSSINKVVYNIHTYIFVYVCAHIPPYIEYVHRGVFRLF